MTGWKHGALNVLRPPAQLTPDGDDEARQSGQPGQHAVGEANAGVGRHRSWRSLERRLYQAVDAVNDEQKTDAAPQIGRVEIGEQDRSDRDADGAADDEWCKPFPGQRVPELPDAIALGQKSIAGDQSCRLNRRDDVQPYAGHDETHGKAGQTGCKATRERGKEK
jgi:hypothetical protein